MQKMCKKSVEADPESLEYIPDCLKMQEICNEDCAGNHTP